MTRIAAALLVTAATAAAPLPRDRNRSPERPGTAYLGVVLNDAAGGVAVTEVFPEGPADVAGVRAGDVVVRAGDAPLPGADALRAALRGQRPGAEMALRVVRPGGEVTLRVRLGDRPTERPPLVPLRAAPR